MPEHEEQHFYGGQAVIEGVMMRGQDRYAVAVRRADGEMITIAEPLQGLAVKPGWHKAPLIRGCYMLVEGLTLGWQALQFSANVLTAEEREKEQAAKESGEGGAAAATGTEEKPELLGRIWMLLTTLLSFALGIGLFIILPTAVPQWIFGSQTAGLDAHSVLLNVIEGGVRLLVIVLYITLISLMKYVRRVFQYHGAEHATINCYEAGGPVTVENCARFSPLHPRCGTAFLLVVIVVKIIVGCFFGWPAPWIRIALRLAVLPAVAAVAYEVLRWSGRHRNSLLARALAAPGLLLQMLTTRHPDLEQIATAIYALAAVAPEVPLPEGFAPPRRVNLQVQTIEEESPAPVAAEGAK